MTTTATLADTDHRVTTSTLFCKHAQSCTARHKTQKTQFVPMHTNTPRTHDRTTPVTRKSKLQKREYR